MLILRVHHYIVWSDHQFARAGHAAQPIEARLDPQLLHLALDLVQQPDRSVDIVLGDVIDEFDKVVARRLPPAKRDQDACARSGPVRRT